MSRSRIKVSFVCQQCSQPLVWDKSFFGLDQRNYDDLLTPVFKSNVLPPRSEIPSIDATTVQGDARVFRKVVPPLDSGFTLLGEPEENTSLTISHKLQVTSELFDILSGRSEIDHPLCEECTDNLVDLLDQQLRNAEDDCSEYKEFLEQLGNSIEVDKELDNEIDVLVKNVSSLNKQLQTLEMEREAAKKDIEKEIKKSKELSQKGNEYAREYNERKRQLLEYNDAKRSVENQIAYGKAQLNVLRKTNAFNATFFIWNEEHFGTINGFRLGRLPDMPVEWNEINAAWGQTVLLIYSLAKKLNIEFQRYRLVPFGNHSYLESLVDKSKDLPLYGSGGIRFFWDTKFDQAMVAFLDILQQFMDVLEQRRRATSTFLLPYKVDKGRLIDVSNGLSYSIKIQFNSEEQWTKALKFLLTNLKWCLAWATSPERSK